MNARQAIRAILTAMAVSSILRPGLLAAQDTAAKPVAGEGNTIYLHPVAGSEAAKIGAGLFLKPTETAAWLPQPFAPKSGLYYVKEFGGAERLTRGGGGSTESDAFRSRGGVSQSPLTCDVLGVIEPGYG